MNEMLPNSTFAVFRENDISLDNHELKMLEVGVYSLNRINKGAGRQRLLPGSIDMAIVTDFADSVTGVSRQ